MKEELLKVKEGFEFDIKSWSGGATNGGNPKYAQIAYSDYLKISEALALLDSIISMLDSPWQPIGTVPLDGTEIVIQDMYYDKNGNKNLGERYVAYYQPEEACWFDGSSTWIDVCPDYWMPLPSIESIRNKDNGKDT